MYDLYLSRFYRFSTIFLRGFSIRTLNEKDILTSFIFRRAGAKNCPVIHRVVEKNPRALQDAPFESFTHDERPVHVVIGQRKNRSVVRCVGDHLSVESNLRELVEKFGVENYRRKKKEEKGMERKCLERQIT